MKNLNYISPGLGIALSLFALFNPNSSGIFSSRSVGVLNSTLQSVLYGTMPRLVSSFLRLNLVEKRVFFDIYVGSAKNAQIIVQLYRYSHEFFT